MAFSNQLLCVNTNVLFVDVNGNDNNDGSNEFPFRTITAAMSVASTGNIIKVNPGTYVGDITFKQDVKLQGSGHTRTVVDGIIIASLGKCVLEGFSFTKKITVGSDATIRDLVGVVTDVQVEVSASSPASVYAENLTIHSTGKEALLMSGSGTFIGTICDFTSSGDFAAILQTNGRMNLNTVSISGSRATSPLVDSNAGSFNIDFSSVINVGGGGSIDVANGATTIPNSVVDVIVVGNVVCSTAVTIIEGLNVTGTLSGTNLLFRPSSILDNDSSVTGSTVKDALEHLDSNKAELVGSSDIEITDNTKGVILASATKRWRIKVSDLGVISTEEVE